jgi:hypothetical protein
MEANTPSKYTILYVVIAVVGIGQFVVKQTETTAEQKKFIDDYHYSRPRAWLKSLCEEKTACEKYVDVRQQCATAGSISECVKIKMNGSVPNFCADDGHVVINSLFTGRFDLTEKNLVPSSLQCFALNFVKKEE